MGEGGFQFFVSFSIQQQRGEMWEYQTAVHCYDCQRVQQEQAPEQREGRMGGRKQDRMVARGVKDALFYAFFPLEKKKTKHNPQLLKANSQVHICTPFSECTDG